MNKPVIIIDDDPVNLLLMEATFRWLKYDVLAFDNPLIAWEAIKKYKYDLIVLDMEMPDMNGLVLTQKIRNLYNDECLIVMMTGHESTNLLDEALNYGVDDYIVKPVSRKILQYRLRIIENQMKKMYERLHFQKELIKSQEHYMAIFHNSSVGVLILDKKGNIVEYNETLSKITGFVKISLRDKFIIHCVHKNETEKISSFFENLISSHRESSSTETRIVSRSGLELICKFNANMVQSNDNPDENFIMVLIEDITEKKKYEEELKYNALHDPLTQLPNRDLFFDRLNKILLEDVSSKARAVSVLILDIDRFQIINETLGHTKGDMLIQQIAMRLYEIVEPGDTLARLTGDEFGIITEKYVTVGELTHFINKLQTSLLNPFHMDSNDITITASIGIKVYEGGEESTSNVLRDADTALHRAKNKGPNSYSFFIQKMTLESHQTLKLENELRKAIESNDLDLHYQPQLDLMSNQIIGVEALLRWEHATIGNIPPKKFIPIAENAGLIQAMGNMVLLKAIDKCIEWEKIGISPLKISVNVSPIQFKDKNFLELVSYKVKELHNCKNSLQIELTESVLMENPKEAIEIILKMRRMGIELAIDDFGTGYSSLTYLRSLPISILKIDSSFVENISTSESDRSIVMAIISMAHSMKMKAVAEGVETREQLLRLETMYCDIIQGFFIGKPMNEANFIEFVSKNTQKDLIYIKK